MNEEFKLYVDTDQKKAYYNGQVYNLIEAPDENDPCSNCDLQECTSITCPGCYMDYGMWALKKTSDIFFEEEAKDALNNLNNAPPHNLSIRKFLKMQKITKHFTKNTIPVEQTAERTQNTSLVFTRKIIEL